jgi:hypothetical protein
MTPIPRVSAKKYKGLGDVVEALAKPIARVLGRDPNCPGCAKRKGLLNRTFPFGK